MFLHSDQNKTSSIHHLTEPSQEDDIFFSIYLLAFSSCK
jgi:hypothetical protein